MRPSLIPRRQVARLCDACRQQLQGQQRALSSRTLATPSLSRPTAAATSPIAIAQHGRQSPRPATRSVHHSRSPPRAAASEEQPSPPGGDGANSKEAAPAATSSGPGPEVPQTHYDLFPQTLPRGPPPAGPFRVDVRALRREYLALQARAHPDAHARAPSLKRRAEAASARINEAFHTLASPFRRAVYVLRLRGVRDAEDEAARVEDPALLAAVLEARERVEDAASEDDLAAPRAENEDRIRASEAVLEDAFARDDLEVAKREVVRLRYWVNVRESIDNWERGRPVVLEH